jgi:hypothetical protein
VLRLLLLGLQVMLQTGQALKGSSCNSVITNLVCSFSPFLLNIACRRFCFSSQPTIVHQSQIILVILTR